MVEQGERRSYKSAMDLMENPHYWLSSEIGQIAFGRIFRSLREREGYSQRALAAHLQIDETTICRMEMGKNKPPHNMDFYDRLQTIGGWDENDTAFLMGTSAHRLLFPEREPKRKLANIQDDVKVERISVHISLTADRNIVPKDEHYEIMEMLKPIVRISLRENLKHVKTNRSQQVSQ